MAAQKGTVPKGYIKEDIVDLIKISRITGLDINVMAKMASILSRIEVYAKEAGSKKLLLLMKRSLVQQKRLRNMNLRQLKKRKRRKQKKKVRWLNNGKQRKISRTSEEVL